MDLAGLADAPQRTYAAGGTADHRQAEYFLDLLLQRRRLTDERIAEYRRAGVAAQNSGDAERAYGLRRLAHGEEQDRRTLDRLIENLHRRFPRRAGARSP